MAILLVAFGGSANSWGLKIKPPGNVAEKSPDLSILSEESKGGEAYCDLNLGSETLYSVGDDMPIRRSSSHVLFVGKYLCFHQTANLSLCY